MKYDSRHALYPVPNVFVPVPDRVGFDAARDTVFVAAARAVVVCVAPRGDCAVGTVAARDTVLTALVRGLVVCCVAVRDDCVDAVVALRDTVLAAAARAATDVPVVRFGVVARALVLLVVRWTAVADGATPVRATVAAVDCARFTLVASRTAASAKPMHAHIAAIKSKIFLILVD